MTPHNWGKKFIKKKVRSGGEQNTKTGLDIEDEQGFSASKRAFINRASRGGRDATARSEQHLGWEGAETGTWRGA